MQKNIKWIWIVLLVLFRCYALHAQILQAHLEGDRLHVSASQLRFLDGYILERLHDGASVPFTFQLSAAPTAGAKAISQVVAHFVLSFDLWEEHFSVVETNSARRLASRLSLTAAENWCIDNMTLPVSSLQEHGSVVLRLDIRAEDSRGTSESESKSSLSMAGLIDIFSRKSKDQPLSWSATSAPMRLSDVKQRNMTKPPRSQGGR